MKVKCAACGKEMEISAKASDNIEVKCPHCGEHLKVVRPHRIDLPVGKDCPRYSPSERQNEKAAVPRRHDLHVRRPQSGVSQMAPVSFSNPLPKSPVRPEKRKSKDLSDGAIYVILILAVIGFGFYFWKRTRSVPVQEMTMPAQMASNTVVRADDDLKKRQEARRRQEETDRAKRREEQARRDAEREQKRRDMVLKAEQERAYRELVAKSVSSFRATESVFASDFPVGKRPFDFSEDGVFTVADENFVVSRVLYRLTVEGKRLKSVQRISTKNGAEDIAHDAFMNMTTNKVVLAKMESGPVWICGNTPRSERMKCPDMETRYAPLSDFVGEAFSTMKALGTRPPLVKYRVSLQAKNGRDVIKFGIVEKEIDLREIRSKIRERITDRKLQKAGAELKPPRMKKFKRTVLLYDGEKIVKEITGITKVPRSFRHFGTSHANDKSHVSDIVERARRKWEELRMEAERQDQEELSVEAENQRRKDEYRHRMDTMLRDAKATEEEVKVELDKYFLLIERSRTRMRDN